MITYVTLDSLMIRINRFPTYPTRMIYHEQNKNNKYVTKKQKINTKINNILYIQYIYIYTVLKYTLIFQMKLYLKVTTVQQKY